MFTWLSLFALVTNVGVLIYNWRLMRRWQLLNDLLDDICIMAWANRHVQIWVPWCTMRGVGFKFQIVPLAQIIKDDSK